MTVRLMFKAARRAARAARLGALAFVHAAAPATARPTPVGWREGRILERQSTRKSRGRGRFDKGTLAMAQIGLTRAG